MRFLKTDSGTITSTSYLTGLLCNFSFLGTNHLVSSSYNIYWAPEINAVQSEAWKNLSDKASLLEPWHLKFLHAPKHAESVKTEALEGVL